MILVGLIISFFTGMWLCNTWMGHRAKYYQKQLQKTIIMADSLNEINELLLTKLKRLEHLEDENALQAKIDKGILEGIVYVQDKALKQII